LLPASTSTVAHARLVRPSIPRPRVTAGRYVFYGTQALSPPAAMRSRRSASSAAARKLPKRLRMVLSHGLIPDAVQESWVGMVPWSATKRRTASRASASRSAVSVSQSNAGPLNTPGRFVKWELGSTKF